jgi:uncharacterized protein (TIGR00730 family)
MNQIEFDSVDQLVAEALRITKRTGQRTSEDLLRAALGLLTDETAPLDLKITSAAVQEMRQAFETFAPYRAVPKVTIFGSARTNPNDPLYQQARTVATKLATNGWMVVTGAGPGIMAAAMEGAGREHSFGVNIRLPFEQGANPIIAGDAKLVSMKYFFTRKLMLIKESKAFICLPGGFGTLDETFELITLCQTGKSTPVPIVFLDTPGDPYWEAVDTFVRDHLLPRGLIEPADAELYFVTDSCDAAVDEVEKFYANFDSIRFVGDLLYLRMKTAPTGPQMAALNTQFSHLCSSGTITLSNPHKEEVADNDRLELARVLLRFDKRHWGELRNLIDALNDCVK